MVYFGIVKSRALVAKRSEINEFQLGKITNETRKITLGKISFLLAKKTKTKNKKNKKKRMFYHDRKNVTERNK